MTKPKKQELLDETNSKLDSLDRNLRNKARITILLTAFTTLNIIFYILRDNDSSSFKTVIPDIEFTENMIIPGKMIAYVFVVLSVVLTFSYGKEIYSLKKQKSLLQDSQKDLTVTKNVSKIVDIENRIGKSNNEDNTRNKKQIKQQIEEIQTTITTNSKKIGKEISNVLGFGGLNLLCAYYYFSSMLSSEKTPSPSISIGQYCVPILLIVQIPLLLSTAVTAKSFYNYYHLSKQNDRLDHYLEQLMPREPSISKLETKKNTAAIFTKTLRIKIRNKTNTASIKHINFISSNTHSQKSTTTPSTQHYPKTPL
jgi:hypothetical protein